MPINKIKEKLEKLEEHLNMCFPSTHVCDNACSGEEAKGYGEVLGEIKAYQQVLAWMAKVKPTKVIKESVSTKPKKKKKWNS